MCRALREHQTRSKYKKAGITPAFVVAASRAAA
jgi:hypothetical protein